MIFDFGFWILDFGFADALISAILYKVFLLKNQIERLMHKLINETNPKSKI